MASRASRRCRHRDVSRAKFGFLPSLGYDFFDEGQFDVVRRAWYRGRMLRDGPSRAHAALRGARKRHALMLSGRYDVIPGLRASCSPKDCTRWRTLQEHPRTA